MMPGGKLLARNLRRRRISQRMANVTHLNAMPPVKFLLKGKDHNHLANIFFELPHAVRAPGPYLRADKVENRNAQAMQFARQAQVEVREVDQYGRVRFAF